MGKVQPEEKYLETIEGRCVVGEVWEEFDPQGRTTWTVVDGERVEVPVNEALVLSSQTARVRPATVDLFMGEWGEAVDATPMSGEETTPTEYLHRPVLDIDVPARLIPSTTPGHHHLYLDIDMTWEKYEALLKALASAGVIEQGYLLAALNRRATFVRLPWVAKKKED